MTDEELKRLRSLCEAATPITEDMIHRYDHGGGRVMRFIPSRDLVADLYTAKDRECWIAARNALPSLLDALEAAEARERRLREALTTIKTAAKNVVWNAGRGVRAAGSEYDRCWEHVSNIAGAALAAKEGA